MENEERIISMLENLNGRMDEMTGRMDEMTGRMGKMQEDITGLTGRMDEMTGRMDKMQEDITDLKSTQNEMNDRLRHVEITVENDVLDGIQLLREGHEGIEETMAKKEDIVELREDLGLQKFRIDVITEHIKQG